MIPFLSRPMKRYWESKKQNFCLKCRTLQKYWWMSMGHHRIDGERGIAGSAYLQLSFVGRNFINWFSEHSNSPFWTDLCLWFWFQLCLLWSESSLRSSV